MLYLSESSVQAESPPLHLEQVHVEIYVQAPRLAQRSTPTFDMLDYRCTQQPSTQALVQVHERELVSAPNARHNIHEALSEDEVLAQALATQDENVGQETLRTVKKRKFIAAENTEGSHETPYLAQATLRRHSSRILEQSRAPL